MNCPGCGAETDGSGNCPRGCYPDEVHLPESNTTRPCSECGSYAFHDKICSQNPADPLNSPDAPWNPPFTAEANFPEDVTGD